MAWAALFSDSIFVSGRVYPVELKALTTILAATDGPIPRATFDHRPPG